MYRFPVFLFLIFYCDICQAEDKKELSRDKKDVSTLKNIASSIVGNKFNQYPTGDYDWNYKNYPYNRQTFRPGWGYHGSFGGSYIGTYERGFGSGIGGYVYNRPNGAHWFKSTYPSVADDTVVVYPASGSAALFPTAPSSPGGFITSGHSTYAAPSVNAPFLSAPSGPAIQTIPSLSISQPIPQPPLIQARPAIGSVPFNQYLPQVTNSFDVVSTPVSQPIPVISSRPAITSVVRPQPLPAISTNSVSIVPSLPPQTIIPELPPTPNFNLPPSVRNSIDTPFLGYSYDKPDIPFF